MTMAPARSSRDSDLLSTLSCPPRWGTPRNPDRPTLGPRVGEVARLLGHPLMPWQQHVVDVALELDPLTGLPVYREMVLTTPRQQGKTLLILAAMVHRCVGFGPPHGRRQNVLYTAQTRNDARKKLEDDHLPILDASKLRGLYRTRMTNGSEAVIFTNKSKIGITSSTEKAGHGETLDLGVVDEAFAQSDDRLEQAMKPAMLTRPNAQLWVVSAGGKASSAYLMHKIQVGRDLVDAGISDGVCYFEWSADPGDDPADPQTWRSCMPALGYTISEAAVAADQKSMKPLEFRRACLNIAETATAAEWQVITQAHWNGASDRDAQHAGPVALAVDVTPDRSAAAIAAAGRRTEGGRLVEVTGTPHGGLDHRPGVAWVIPRLKEIAAAAKPCVIVVNDRSLADAAAEAGITVHRPTAGDMVSACNGLYDGIAGAAPGGRDVRHLGQPQLTAAVAGATKRTVGDAWAWDRRSVTVDICPLVAASLALWGLGQPRLHTARVRPRAVYG